MSGHLLWRKRRAYDRALRLVACMHNLVEQKPLPQDWRDFIRNLIGSAILPWKAHRHHLRARAPDHFRGENVPLRLYGRAEHGIRSRYDP